MMYPIDEVLVNWNLFRKFKIIILAAFLCVWLGTGVRAYADDESKNQFTFGNNTNVQFYIESPFYYTQDATDEIKIPLYMVFNTQLNNEYFSGYLNGNITAFNIIDGNGSRWGLSYFESTRTDINVVYMKNSASFMIYFDSALIRTGVRECIGYLHYMGTYNGDTVTLTCSNYSQNLNVSSYQLYYTDYQWGFVNAMIYAINNASDVDTIIEYLYVIKNNAPLLNDILSELELQSPILNQIYNKDVELYNLLYNYINNSNNGANAASQAAADLAGKAADQHVAEASLAALSPGNMSDLDSADGLAVLDNVTNATRFWSTLVTQFSEVSGILWGVFIIALLLGLIAFILRLR